LLRTLLSQEVTVETRSACPAVLTSAITFLAEEAPGVQ
jgi:hypothetical protein